MTNKEINKIFADLAEYNRIKEEAEQAAEALKDQIKAYMTENALDTLAGLEHKATYKPVTASRLDTAKIKKDMPKIAEAYTVTTTSNRFIFA